MSIELYRLKIHSKFINKAMYYITPVIYILGDLSLAAAGFYLVLFVCSMLSLHIEALNNFPIWYVTYIYIGCSGVAVLFGLIHFFYWNYFKTKLDLKCHHCKKKVTATTNAEEPELIATVTPAAEFHMLRNSIRNQVYRPRLWYKCQNCGHEGYICPYCHKPIDKEDSKCPHCGKRNVS